MSYADRVFKDMCKDILENGTDTTGEEVRPIWTDTNEKAYTIKKFGVVNRYDLRKEFPALTLRKTGIKSAYDEILWIFQRKSNNIKDLKPNIWDEWANKNGSIGKASGYQVGKLFIVDTIRCDKLTLMNYGERIRYVKSNSFLEELPEKLREKVLRYNEYKSCKFAVHPKNTTISVEMDQMDFLLYSLKYQPYSRRHIISLWNVHELHCMNLNPCCWSCNFVVTNENDKLTLNLVLNQRSNDVLAANNWNVCQYALLLKMVAQVNNMVAGELVHIIADAHIYDRHIPMIKELLDRKEFDAPIVSLDPNVTDFYDFNYDSLRILDYQYGPQIEDIPIAV